MLTARPPADWLCSISPPEKPSSAACTSSDLPSRSSHTSAVSTFELTGSTPVPSGAGAQVRQTLGTLERSCQSKSQIRDSDVKFYLSLRDLSREYRRVR